jgi:hypothetical protein
VHLYENEVLIGSSRFPSKNPSKNPNNSTSFYSQIYKQKTKKGKAEKQILILLPEPGVYLLFLFFFFV